MSPDTKKSFRVAEYIGHSIVSRAVLVGMERAISEMKTVIQQNYPQKT